HIFRTFATSRTYAYIRLHSTTIIARTHAHTQTHSVYFSVFSVTLFIGRRIYVHKNYESVLLTVTSCLVSLFFSLFLSLSPSSLIRLFNFFLCLSLFCFILYILHFLFSLLSISIRF